MIIESKFHDYYDCIQSLGIDKTIVFKRHEQDLITKNKLFCDLHVSHGIVHRAPSVVTRFIILFCGKSYAGFEINEGAFLRLPKNALIPHNTRITYNLEDALSYYTDAYSNNRYWSYSINLTKDWYLKYNDKPYDPNFFIENKSPIFYFKEYTEFIIKNPKLKDFKFQTIVDPFNAYQEIYQFIGGVIGQPDKETTLVDEKTKIQSKGFDKWSFRKQPKAVNQLKGVKL